MTALPVVEQTPRMTTETDVAAMPETTTVDVTDLRNWAREIRGIAHNPHPRSQVAMRATQLEDAATELERLRSQLSHAAHEKREAERAAALKGFNTGCFATRAVRIESRDVFCAEWLDENYPTLTETPAT